MLYKSDKPYPKVRIEAKNKTYANRLLQNFSGIVSEETAIHLYLYQAISSSDNFLEYKEIMYHIAEVEMHHLRILGELIYKLGGRPIYGEYTSDCVFKNWSSNYINYTDSLKKRLLLDIASEKQAIKNYEQTISFIKDQFIEEILKRIIEDEFIHIKIFEELYHKYFGESS